MESDNTAFRDGQRDVLITAQIAFRFALLSSFSKRCGLSLHLKQQESSSTFPKRRRLFLGLPLSVNRFHSREHFINLYEVDLSRFRLLYWVAGGQFSVSDADRDLPDYALPHGISAFGYFGTSTNAVIAVFAFCALLLLGFEAFVDWLVPQLIHALQFVPGWCVQRQKRIGGVTAEIH
jgi:hypothetical protein